MQNYGFAYPVLWTMKNHADVAPSLEGYNSAWCGSFLFKICTYIPKLTYFQILLKVFIPNVSFGGCLSKYRWAFIVCMFGRPPEVFILASDNGLISGSGKAPISVWPVALQYCHSHHAILGRNIYMITWAVYLLMLSACIPHCFISMNICFFSASMYTLLACF